MKWKTTRYVPKENDTRIVRKFAFLPTECNGGYTVWLETYDSMQKYKVKSRFSHLGRFIVKESKWVETERIYLEVWM